MVLTMKETKPTFEQCLNYKENILGYKFFDRQKELLRECYDNSGKELCIVFSRLYGINKFYMAKALLDEFLKEN